ncbi:solute carrier family 35 member F6 isoform X2 [Phlebotomus papatasi]|uniref:EamA domain-containing protein n=1 Tax=Phlebotomus papatasi TaxID=29031 RepID=A0A1B0DGQ6_PHLPP|nr:solute carrier family 35 member F6 isoform X2 [Phlebotomus papatasi]
MAWSQYQLILAATMVVTGSINTLSTKWADYLESEGSDGQIRAFSHPFVQACAMFIGEMLCLLAFKMLYYNLKRRRDGSEDTHELTRGNREFNPFILFIPAMCDMIATSIMYIGLNLTYPSSFQMFRGSVIIFVGMLSVAFLNRVLVGREWTGIFFVIIGLAIVGVSDFIADDGGIAHSRNNIITGDLLIILAQVITSVQMVYEERYVAGLDIPALQAVGWEGFFGFSVLGTLLIPFYFIHVGPPFNNNARGTLEDFVDALVQIRNSWQLLFSIFGTIISIAFFNFAGISVTKEISATTRMVLDSVRTLVVWLVAICVRWQMFHPLQILGFGGLLFGMCLYNNVFVFQCWSAVRGFYLRRRYGYEETQGIITTRADDPQIA